MHLSNIRYISRVKWSNWGKGVVPSSTPRCCIAIKKGAFWSPSITVANFTILLILKGSQYKWNNYEMLIRILRSLLNRSISIIMNSCYHGEFTVSQSSTYRLSSFSGDLEYTDCIHCREVRYLCSPREGMSWLTQNCIW